MKADKPHYGFDYWLQQLVEIGREVEAVKYTEHYIDHMRREWSRVGLTKLHMAVLERKKLLTQIK